MLPSNALGDRLAPPRACRMKRLGFSLSGIALVALLVPLTVSLLHQRQRTQELESLLALRRITRTLDACRTKHAGYPISSGSIRPILPVLAPFDPSPCGPLDPTDAWGNDIQYLSSGVSYVLWSNGADGQPDNVPVRGPFTDWNRDIIIHNGRGWALPEPACNGDSLSDGAVRDPRSLVQAERTRGAPPD